MKWHHRITHFPDVQFEGSISEHKKVKDFCTYTRWFLWKLLVVIPLVSLLIGSYLGCYFAGWWALFTVDHPSFIFFLNEHLVWYVTNGLLLIGSILFVIAYLNEKAKIRKARKKQEKIDNGTYVEPQPSFLKLWYMKVKHKFCPKMEY